MVFIYVATKLVHEILVSEREEAQGDWIDIHRERGRNSRTASVEFTC